MSRLSRHQDYKVRVIKVMLMGTQMDKVSSGAEYIQLETVACTERNEGLSKVTLYISRGGDGLQWC